MSDLYSNLAIVSNRFYLHIFNKIESLPPEIRPTEIQIEMLKSDFDFMMSDICKDFRLRSYNIFLMKLFACGINLNWVFSESGSITIDGNEYSNARILRNQLFVIENDDDMGANQ